VTTRLVTFLGLGDDRKPSPGERYGSGRYSLDGCVTARTWNHDVAAATRYTDLASVLVLGTEKVRRVWFEESDEYREELRRSGFAPLVGFGLIPSGRTTAERWGIFEAITRALSPSPMRLGVPDGPSVEELEAPDTVLLDVTHGFRSQPFFAASAVAFARAGLGSTVRPEAPAPIVRILYAAWEMRENGEDGPVAPIWDLTQFVRVMEWSSAISSMMRHGRGDDLEKLLRDEQRAAFGAHGVAAGSGGGRKTPPGFQKLGTACRTFADGLATARIPDVTTGFASHLLGTIEGVKRDVCRDVPPLTGPLEELQEWCRPLSAGSAVSVAGLKAGVQLARRYMRMERFLEAAVALRETITSAWCVATRAEPYAQPSPGGTRGSEGFRVARETHDRELGRRAREADARMRPGEKSLLAAFSAISPLRNDIEHGGFNDQPRDAGAVRSQLEKAVTLLEETIGTLLGEELPWPSPEGTRGCFVNLSNHPVEDWSAAQVSAAEAFGLGPPVDCSPGFPQVDPDADDEAVADLAKETVERVARMNPGVVFVSGEFTLTFAIVAGLRGRGIRCVAATTRRTASEQVQPDGAVVRTSRFEFVRWREFPE
jgi:CRISPR-associated protein Csx16